MIGRFVPKENKEGKIIVEQVQAYQKEDVRLHISKQIQTAAMKNMMSVLKYYRKKGHDLDRKIEQIEKCMTKLDAITSISSLMLLEARIKQIYYSCFDIILVNEPFSFEKRTKYPPQNEINAMLSYGYSLLYSIILSKIDQSSLLPQVSFIHGLSKNKDSLHFDIADIYKPILIDRLVLKIIRRRQVQVDCFEYSNNGRCYMNDKGVELFIKEFDKFMESTVTINNKQYSYKSLLSREVYNLTKYILNQSNLYRPYLMRW